MGRCVLWVSVIVALVSCDKGRIQESYWRERGAEAVTPLKTGLKRALTQAVENEGAAEAVTACQAIAPSITRGAASKTAKVGRSSHKLRSPRNAPKPWMEPLLRGYLEAPGQMEPKVVVVDEDTVGYVEPIYVQPMCVACHGTEIAPEVRERITELYPDDQATGFQPGDFRGILWAELDRN